MPQLIIDGYGAMNKLFEELLPFLKDLAFQEAQYPLEYMAQCRQAEVTYQALWDSFSSEQQELYLEYEAARNAQSATAEEQLFLQAFRIARALYH